MHLNAVLKYIEILNEKCGYGLTPWMSQALPLSDQVSVSEVPRPIIVDYELEAINYNFGNIDDYALCSRIGRGKYSTVFSGVTKDGKPCVLKVLKPVRLSKINREIKILEALKEAPNVCRILDVVRDTESGTITLVLDYADNVDFRFLYSQLSIRDIAMYIFKILRALEAAHARGIMHRDIKPQNIMIDPTTHKLRVIDWGLADFYTPGTAYQVRVATRHYKGPELLLGYSYYDTSLDIWGLGCTFGTMLFRRAPFFRGRDNDDLLAKIIDTVGSEEIEAYIEKYQIQVPPALASKISGHKKKPWEHFRKDETNTIVTPLAIDLLSKMLRVDPSARITAKEALEHPFFDDVREQCLQEEE